MDYLNANSVEEALKFLESYRGNARVITGGTDLILDKEAGKISADALVDVTTVKNLSYVRLQDNCIEIGGATTLSEIYRNELMKEYFPSVCQGINTIGSKQIRNIATLSGNIVSAQPAADGAIAIAPLQPILEVSSIHGVRDVFMQETYAGFGKSTIDPSSEILTEIKLPLLQENERASFYRLELRKSLSLPMLNVGIKARIFVGKVEDVIVNMAPVGVGTKRATQLEEWFINKEFTKGNIQTAAKLSLLDASPRSNPLRGSKEYREQTLPIIVERAFYDIANQLKINI